MAKDYLYIRAWGIMLGSMAYYIENQVELARKDKAPQNAIYKEEDGWHTADKITSDITRKEIEARVKTM